MLLTLLEGSPTTSVFLLLSGLLLLLFRSSLLGLLGDSLLLLLSGLGSSLLSLLRFLFSGGSLLLLLSGLGSSLLGLLGGSLLLLLSGLGSHGSSLLLSLLSLRSGDLGLFRLFGSLRFRLLGLLGSLDPLGVAWSTRLVPRQLEAKRMAEGDTVATSFDVADSAGILLAPGPYSAPLLVVMVHDTFAARELEAGVFQGADFGSRRSLEGLEQSVGRDCGAQGLEHECRGLAVAAHAGAGGASVTFPHLRGASLRFPSLEELGSSIIGVTSWPCRSGALDQLGKVILWDDFVHLWEAFWSSNCTCDEPGEQQHIHGKFPHQEFRTRRRPPC